MFKLIRGGHIYTPEDIGVCDILLCAGTIVKIGKDIAVTPDMECEIVDASGKSVTPGFVDGHIHFLGAGGGKGPDSRSGIVHLSTIARAGVTTGIGVLGVDPVGYSIRELYVRARALEEEGLTTYMLSGSFALPSVSITGSIRDDLCFVDKVIGRKIAMQETLKATPDKETLKAIFNETWTGGRLGGKAGVVVSHLGAAKGSLSMVADLLDELAVPQRAFVATHINRTPAALQDAIACGKRGMILDITGNYRKDGIVEPNETLKVMLEAGVPLENITFSSDSGAVLNWHGNDEFLPVDICVKEMAKMVHEQGIPLSVALSVLTRNPAKVYCLDARKGSLEVGKDADVVLLDKDIAVDTVIARGRTLVAEGKPVVRGRLEKSLLALLQ